MATFVLVPGFWLGAWAWDAVTDRLRADGHMVHALTMPGIAERSEDAKPGLDLAAEIADIVAYLRRHELSEVVLVGHSGGNMPVTGVVDEVPELIARVVYVDSGPMPSGLGVIDFDPPEAQAAKRQQVAEEGEGWQLPVPHFDADQDPVNLAGISAADLERMLTLGSPQPFRTVTDTLDRPGDVMLVPATAVCCTFSPDQVTQLAGMSPIFALMTKLDLRHLPTGHWPQFSRPDDLAELLGDIASGADIADIAG